MRSMVEGALPLGKPLRAPSTTAFGGGPPPRSGEEFAPRITSIRDGSRVVIAAACPAGATRCCGFTIW